MSSAGKNFWLLMAVILLLLASISYTGDGRVRLSALEGAFLDLVNPVQDFLASTGDRVHGFFTTVVQFQEIKEENEQLRAQLAEKEEQMVKIQEVMEENRRLRELVDFKEQVDREMVAAKVVSRDPSRWFNTITLNRGYEDGIEVEMAVVTPEGLAGMISSVSSHSSQALLITNPRFAASAVVQRSRDPGQVGIVEGQAEDSSQLKMINLPPDADVKEEDKVVTSGKGGVFPKGLLVGEVISAEMDQQGLVKSAQIDASVNIHRLEEVMVVISHEGDHE